VQIAQTRELVTHEVPDTIDHQLCGPLTLSLA
jgi:hypothetical protein